MKQQEWQWFGNAGHFICSRWCRFHLTTKVGPWLVSTIGEYVHPRHSGGSEQTETNWLEKNYPGEDVGYKRKYETMVFKAGKPCKENVCGKCGIPSIDGMELDFNGYNTAGAATRGHLELCQKWSKRKGTKNGSSEEV